MIAEPMTRAGTLTRSQAAEDPRLLALWRQLRDESKPLILIDADNNGDRTGQSLEEIARTGQAFAFTPKEGIGVLDLDTPRGLHIGARIAQRLEAELSLRPVLTASGSPGRAHVWFLMGAMEDHALRIIGEETKDLTKKEAAWRTGMAMRPPGSPHRKGGKSIPQGLSIRETVARLTPRLSPQQADYLRSQEASEDRSAAFQASANAFAIGGFTLDQWRRRITHHKDAEKYQGARRWTMETERSWRKAGLFILANPRINRRTNLEVDELVQWVSAISSKALRSGPKETLIAMLRMAEKAGGTTLHASVREIAEASGKGFGTVSKHLKKMIAAELVQVVWSGHHSELANLYTLLPSVENGNTPPSHPLGTPYGCDRSVSKIDILPIEALDALNGKPGARLVYSRLHPGRPRLAQELAERLGMTVACVRYHLRNLQRYGLAERTLNGWILTEGRERLDELAKVRETLGRAARREIEHTRQRQAWRENIRYECLMALAKKPNTGGGTRTPRGPGFTVLAPSRT